MSREDYVELVQDFCEEVGFENVDELLHNGLLQVDDALVAIEYLDDRDEIRLLMDLGEIEPEEDKAAMLALLLESNLNNTSAYLPTFSIHPGTGHPIVAYHLPLAILLEDGRQGLAAGVDDRFHDGTIVDNAAFSLDNTGHLAVTRNRSAHHPARSLRL